MNLKRITRLLKLLQSLQAGSGRNASDIARACGVTRRTVFRDLETLRAAGVPIGFDSSEDRYFIKGDYFLPPINFTPAEALSIVVLAHQLGADEGLPFFQPARAAAAKLQDSLPSPLRSDLRHISQSVDLRTLAVNRLERQSAVYDQLVAAISRRRVVRILYGSLTEWDDIETKLRPYRLLFNRRSWYVIGRSSLHRAVRTFNVSRIKDLALTAEKYASPRRFSLDRHFGNAWSMIPDVEADDIRVTVRFSQMVAQNVAEVAWHKTQRVESRPDGSIDFHVVVSGLTEIVWWILGYGDQAQVLRPKRLRRLIAQRAANMQRMHLE